MRPEHNKAHVATAAASVATNATQSLSFDTSGFDFANAKVLVGTSATTSAVFTTLKWSESDTVTSPSSQTAIVALTGGTATSTSVGFVLPTAAIAGGGVAAEFQIDLRKRKKYLGCQVTPAQASQVVAICVDLTKDQSADSTTTKAESNLAATSVSSCAKIVTA
jgi:Trk-type K+ transport system membrane component